MTYDKIHDFIETIFNVFKMVNKKADDQKDRRSKCISLMIYNYVAEKAKDNKIDLKNIQEQHPINLIPFFEYIAYNNIELYDFNNIEMNDVDTTQPNDLERFVLTHVYYITQHNK